MPAANFVRYNPFKTNRRARRATCISAPEQLETKALLSNVSMNFDGESVTLNGSSGDETVYIGVEEVGGEAHVKFQGLDGTTINGESEVLLDSPVIPGDLTIRLRGGTNKVLIDQVHISNRLDMRGGGGSDALGMVGGIAQTGISFNGGGGPDTVILTDTSTDRAANLNMGSGRDKVAISDFSVEGDLNIRTAGGNDQIAVTEAEATNMIVRSGGGNDVFYSADLYVTDDLDANMGSGNDDVAVTDSEIQGRSRLNGAGGRDVFNGHGTEELTDLRSFEVLGFGDVEDDILDLFYNSLSDFAPFLV